MVRQAKEYLMYRTISRSFPTIFLLAMLCFSTGARAENIAVVEAIEDYLDFVDYRGGIIFPHQIPREEWKDFYVVDTRDADQYADKHIPGAVNIEWREVFSRRSELPKNKVTLLYCNSGTLSAQAAFALKVAGVKNVLILQGGINEWKAAGGFDASLRTTQPDKN
jgi:rhodanese-related sulfurtransferase